MKGENPWKNNSQNSPIHVLGSFSMSVRVNANGTTATVCVYDSRTFRSFVMEMQVQKETEHEVTLLLRHLPILIKDIYGTYL